MIRVALTANLQKYYPETRFEVEADSLRNLLARMDDVRPLFSDYILDNAKSIRKHVNVFINGELLTDKANIDVALAPGTQVHIMQALSGG